MTGRPAEIIRRIIEVPPATPSSVSRHLDTDLDTILLTALEKEPAHRYGSVREMAEEIRRYLRGDPLLTRRASRLYVLGKKLRKHTSTASPWGWSASHSGCLVPGAPACGSSIPWLSDRRPSWPKDAAMSFAFSTSWKTAG